MFSELYQLHLHFSIFPENQFKQLQDYIFTGPIRWYSDFQDSIMFDSRKSTGTIFPYAPICPYTGSDLFGSYLSISLIVYRTNLLSIFILAVMRRYDSASPLSLLHV